MWSRYLRTRERDGVTAIFHELHPDPVYCDTKQWASLNNGITDGTEVLIGDLKLKKLLVDSSDEDVREFEIVSARLEKKLDQPTILYLMTAQGCNFDCGYCPIPGMAKKHGESLLSVENALAGIDLWQEHLRDVYDPALQYFVIFYGGEPLLNTATISASLQYLKNKIQDGLLPNRISFMIATNGILVDQAVIDMCREYGVMVAVGLDGPKKANDTLRVDRGGNGTYDGTVESIRMLVAAGIKTFASASITPFNINQISEFSSFFESLGVDKFGFNFLKGRALLNLVGEDGAEDYHRRASRGVIENARKQTRPGFEYQMEKKQVAFDTGDFYPVDCTCYGNQLVIQPDGQVSNCPFFKACMGQVQSISRDFRIWNQAIVKEWRKRLPLYHSGEAKAVSGGGCAWSSIELKGDSSAADDSSQIFSEEVLNELIRSRYDRLCQQKA